MNKRKFSIFWIVCVFKKKWPNNYCFFSIPNEVLKYTFKYCNTLYVKWGMSYGRVCVNVCVVSRTVINKNHHQKGDDFLFFMKHLVDKHLNTKHFSTYANTLHIPICKFVQYSKLTKNKTFQFFSSYYLKLNMYK